MRERALGDRCVVDRARGDAQAGVAQRRNERLAEQEVFDAHAAQREVRGPPRERGGRVVRPNDEPAGQTVGDRLLDGGGVEAQDLDPARVRTPRQDGRERVGRAPRQRRVGVRLDVELHREPGRHEVEHLIDQ